MKPHNNILNEIIYIIIKNSLIRQSIIIETLYNEFKKIVSTYRSLKNILIQL